MLGTTKHLLCYKFSGEKTRQSSFSACRIEPVVWGPSSFDPPMSKSVRKSSCDHNLSSVCISRKLFAWAPFRELVLWRCVYGSQGWAGPLREWLGVRRTYWVWLCLCGGFWKHHMETPSQLGCQNRRKLPLAWEHTLKLQNSHQWGTLFLNLCKGYTLCIYVVGWYLLAAHQLEFFHLDKERPLVLC